MLVVLGLLVCGAGRFGLCEKRDAHASPRRAESSEPARVRAARRFLARRGFEAKSRLTGQSASATGRAGIALRGSKTRSAQASTQRLNAVPLATGSPVWTVAGPVGVNSLSFGLCAGPHPPRPPSDPRTRPAATVFLGTTGGGVWKSQNAAASTASSVVFTPVTDGLAALSGAAQAGISVGAVTVQPGGTGVVLAGLGDPNDALDSYYGAGLLRSSEAGSKAGASIGQTVDLQGRFRSACGIGYLGH